MKRLLIAIIPVLTLLGCEETSEEETEARRGTDERLTGIECTASDPVNFEQAMGSITTSPRYILFNVVERSSGETWAVCLQSDEFWDILLKEHSAKLNISDRDAAEKVDELIKTDNTMTFVLSTGDAIERLKPPYSQETLTSLRETMPRHSEDELVELFSSQTGRARFMQGLSSGLGPANSHETQKAIAHILLERGLFCRKSCLDGGLRVVPR